MEALKRFAELDAEHRRLKEAVDMCKKHLASAEAECLAYFEAQGIDKVKYDGRTFFLQTERWPKKCDPKMSPGDVARALHLHQFGEYAPERVNWQGLRSLLIERSNDGLPAVPEELEGLIELEEKYRVKTRVAS